MNKRTCKARYKDGVKKCAFPCGHDNSHGTGGITTFSWNDEDCLMPEPIGLLLRAAKHTKGENIGIIIDGFHNVRLKPAAFILIQKAIEIAND